MAEAEDFRKVITPSVKFSIPEYQRNYSWTDEELGDLWRDLNNVLGESETDIERKSHFYGMFLFDVDEKERQYNIIDGQQRITTAIILLNEIRNRFLELGMDEDADIIADDYIQNRHGYKLSLGREDDDRVLKDEILLEGELESSISTLADTPSQARLLQAKKFFHDKLENKDGAFLDNLKGEIEDLEVLSYEVNSITRAVKIFETANDRGRSLTILDKTKSFLMLQIYLHETDSNEEEISDEINLLQSRFGKMYEKIDEINDDAHWGSFSEDNIQRFHYILWDQDWTTSRGERHFQNLLPHLKERIRSSSRPLDDIEDYSTELQEAFRAHECLTRISDSDDRERYLIKRMELAGSMGNVRPLLLALRMKKGSYISEDDYIELLRRVETLIVRIYVIAQRRAYTGRYKIYNLAREVYQENATVDEIKEQIRQITEEYADDEKLEESLSTKEFYKEFDKSEQRYLMYFYEASLQEESDREKMPFNLKEWVEGKLVGGEKDINIEVDHIHPQTPNEDLGLDELEHRLGNLSILPEGENKSLQNAIRADKEEAYKEINLEMNRDIVSDLSDWNEESILSREAKIKRRLMERWDLQD